MTNKVSFEFTTYWYRMSRKLTWGVRQHPSKQKCRAGARVHTTTHERWLVDSTSYYLVVHVYTGDPLDRQYRRSSPFQLERVGVGRSRSEAHLRTNPSNRIEHINTHTLISRSVYGRLKVRQNSFYNFSVIIWECSLIRLGGFLDRMNIRARKGFYRAISFCPGNSIFVCKVEHWGYHPT